MKQKNTTQPPAGGAVLWQLFSSFFRIGLFTFGGGYAMLPLIEKEVIDRRGWTDRQDILDIYALGQSVPGIIAVNTAIFLGNRMAGPLGAVAAAAGVIAPSLVIIISIASFFQQLQESIWVLRAFSGIRAAVVGLVAAAALRIGLRTIRDKRSLALTSVVFLLSLFTSIHVVYLLIGGAITGWLMYYVFARKEVH